jgi:hypothetical protein
MESNISEAEKYLLENTNWSIRTEGTTPNGTEFIEGEQMVSLNKKNVKISYLQYKQNSPRGVIFLFHGMANCGENTAPIANKLAELNFEVFTYDLIGIILK